jgi:chlorophyll synthase
MQRTRLLAPRRALPLDAVLELLKPITWFAPIWAFACGAVAASGGAAFPWARVLAGMVLAGPLVCGASQAANDWFDRHVDAINQPERPIPSGRLPGQSGLVIALVAAAVALLYAAALGATVLVAAAIALALGWAYSAPPLRLKTDGLLGPGVTGLAYEGLAWITGALVVGGGAAMSRPLLVVLAILYSLGALGIMTLNDFKAIEGDRQMGIRSLPARWGPKPAAWAACWIMAVPQATVVALLFTAGASIRAGVIAALLAGQIALMPRLLRDPEGQARWYSGFGVLLFVAGMMVAAFAVRAGVS